MSAATGSWPARSVASHGAGGRSRRRPGAGADADARGRRRDGRAGACGRAPLDAIPAPARRDLAERLHRREQVLSPTCSRDSEGVFVRRFGGAGDRSELSIRGSTPGQVVVTIDGVRANSTLTGGLDLSRICLPTDRPHPDHARRRKQLGRQRRDRGSGESRDARSRKPGRNTRLSFTVRLFRDLRRLAVPIGHRSASLDYSARLLRIHDRRRLQLRAAGRIDPMGSRRDFDPEIVTRINNDRRPARRHAPARCSAGSGDPPTLRLRGLLPAASPAERIRATDRRRDSPPTRTVETSPTSPSSRWTGSSRLGDGGELDAAAFHRFEALAFRDPSVVFRDPIDLDVKLSDDRGARIEDAWRAAAPRPVPETTS